MDEGYDIVPATEEDLESIADFLRQHFYSHSPLNLGLGAPADRQISDMFALKFLSEGTSLLALSRSGRRIVGACINGENRPSDNNHTEHLLSNEAYATIEKFVDEMEKCADVWEITGADRALYIHILAVDPSTRGQGIGRALMEKTRDTARSGGYPMLRILCTSVYSIKIARGMGMQSVYILPFSEYKDKHGNPVFTPPHPHTEAIMFVLKLTPET